MSFLRLISSLAFVCAPALVAQTAYFTIDRTAVNVIDPVTHQRVASLLAGARSTAMAISPDGNTIYVANAESRSVTIIDAVHNVVIAQASVGSPINYLAVSPDNAFLYFVVSPAGVHQAVATKFDLATKKTVLTAVLPQVSQVYSVSVSADGASLYVPVVSPSGKGIAALDTRTLTIRSVIYATNNVGPALVRNGAAWMLCGESICKIDLSRGTLVAQSPPNYGGFAGAAGFCLDRELTNFYLYPGGNFIYILDPNTLALKQQINGPGGFNAGDVLIGPGGKYLYVSHINGIEIYDVRTYSLVSALPFNFDPLQTFRVSTSGLVYAVGSDIFPGDAVGVLNGADATISAEFESAFFDSLSITPDGSKLYELDLNALYSTPLPPMKAPKPISLPDQLPSSFVGYSTDGSTLYLCSIGFSEPDFVSAVSVASGQVINQYGFSSNSGYGPTAVLSPDKTKIYFATYQDAFNYVPTGISVVDTATFTGHPITGSLPAYNPIGASIDGNSLFVEPFTDSNALMSAGISLLNLTTGQITWTHQYPVPILPFSSSFFLDPKNIALYALTQDTSGNLTFTAFDPTTLQVLSTYALGANSGSFAVTSDETHAFITLDRSRSIVDLNLPSLTLHATIPTGYSPRAIALVP